jgi:hypothetical protein
MKRTSVKPKKSVLELPLLKPILLMALPATTLNLPPAISKAVASKFSFPLSATSQALKSLANIKLHLVVFNSCRSTVIITCTLAIQHRHTALQPRCIANVITPDFPNDRAMLTLLVDNGTGAPKYEH